MGCKAENVAPCSSSEGWKEGWDAVMISQSNWEHVLGSGPQSLSDSGDIEPRPRRLRREASRRGFRPGRDRQIPEEGRRQTKLRAGCRTRLPSPEETVSRLRGRSHHNFICYCYSRCYSRG